MFRRVWVGALDLYETLRADRLLTASCSVEVGRIVEEANGTFRCVFVKVDFDGLSVHEGIRR